MNQSNDIWPTRVIGGFILIAIGIIIKNFILKMGIANFHNLVINIIFCLVGLSLITALICLYIKDSVGKKIFLICLMASISIAIIPVFNIDYYNTDFNKCLLHITNFFIQYWLVIVLVLGLLTSFVIIKQYLKNKKQFRKRMEKILGQTPASTEKLEEMEKHILELGKRTKSRKNKEKIKNKLNQLEEQKEELIIKEDEEKDYFIEEEKDESVRDFVSDLSEVYDYNKLNETETDYLLNKKYVKKDFVPIGETRQRTFLVRANYPESTEHTFLVHNITKEINKYTDKVRIYVTVKPDIVFITNNNKYAFEIEMGFNLKKNKKRLLEKKKANNQAYGRNWYIVPYHSRDARSYARYGKTLRRTQIKDFLHGLFNKK